jgi:hypothetical protein
MYSILAVMIVKYDDEYDGSKDDGEYGDEYHVALMMANTPLLLIIFEY